MPKIRTHSLTVRDKLGKPIVLEVAIKYASRSADFHCDVPDLLLLGKEGKTLYANTEKELVAKLEALVETWSLRSYKERDVINVDVPRWRSQRGDANRAFVELEYSMHRIREWRDEKGNVVRVESARIERDPSGAWQPVSDFSHRGRFGDHEDLDSLELTEERVAALESLLAQIRTLDTVLTKLVRSKKDLVKAIDSAAIKLLALPEPA